ncbi:DUF2715 domain-containing protein [Treponema phagedenis]|uniref:DUF2715 domain-containing protein n=1 Tax=Treponema phagedenis TaxID=162 RepID=UPI0001F63BB1|nr:DUF2715 domain-containing protein [Treponema phagedenis]EFW38263.1 hypothetical protein HMPREF9554_01236 [Treponema phagedenis F0421]
MLAPKLGGSWVMAYEANPRYRESDDKHVLHMGGITLDFDALFNHKSGFSFLITNNIYLLINPTAINNPPAIPLIPLYSLNFLFGYTHGLGTNFEFTAAAGIGISTFVLSAFAISIPIQLNFVPYFTEKYGLYISVAENLAYIIESEGIFINTLNFSIGQSFRL